MYRDEYHPRVKKDLKKLNPRIREEIKTTHIPNILSEPGVGQTLVGDLAGIYSYHFKISNQQFRIAYVVSDEEKIVYILMIGVRESFYDLLKRRM